jgi:hypothetical protein
MSDPTLQVLSGGITSSGLDIWPRGGGLEVQAGATLIAASIAGDFAPGNGIYTGGFVYDYGLAIDPMTGDSWSSGGNTYTGAGGLLVVESGGISEYTTIGIASGTQIGDMVISAGGYAYDTDFVLGLLTVDEGGSANVVDGAGVDEVIAGGTVTSSFINFGVFGGSQLITSGGTAYDTTLSANGLVLDVTQTIASGTATRNALSGDNTEQIVTAGGNAISNSLTSGASQYIAGGTVISTSLGAGTSALISGGTVSDTSISSGAFMLASAGTLVGTTIQNGGMLIALPGVVESGTVVETGGTLADGGVLTLLITNPSSGGFTADIELLVPAPAIAAGVDILAPRDSGGSTPPQPTTYVWNGGSATDFTTDGVLEVASGGQISDVTDLALSAYNGGGADYTLATIGSIDIVSGGAASNVMVSGGDLIIANGGVISGLSVGGFAYVLGQDNANAVVTGSINVNDVGQAALQQGAVANGGITVSALGALTVANQTSGITVSATGQVTILAGGVTTGTNVVGDFADFADEIVDGTASSSVLGPDGREIVQAGGVAILTNDMQGQIDVAGGTIISALLGGNGVAYVSAGSALATQLISTSGEQVVLAGGTASGTFIDVGSEEVDGGTASASYTGESGAEVVKSGGQTVRDTISGFQAHETVFSGAAISTQLSDQGTLLIHAGGSASFASVSGGASEDVAGGVDSGSFIGNSGLLSINGNTAFGSGEQILSGGEAVVQNGGTLAGATISAGGLVVLSTGGLGATITVLSGGTAIADASAALTGLVISNGGTLILSAGSEFANITGVVSAGGVVEVGGVTVSASTTATLPGLQTAPLLSGGLDLQTGARLDYVSPDIKDGGVLSVGSGGAVYTPDIESGGTLVLAAGATDYGQSTDGGGGLIVDDGTLVYGPLPSAANGASPPAPNTYLADDISGTGGVVIAGGIVTDNIDDTSAGNITLGANTTLYLYNGEAAGTGTILAGANDELVYGNYSPSGNLYSNAVAGLTPGDVLQFDLTTNGTPVAMLNGDELNLTDGNQYNVTLDLAGSSIDNSFTAVNEGGILEVLVQPLMISGGYVFHNGESATGINIARGGDVLLDLGGALTSPVITGGTLELSAGCTVAGGITFAGAGRLVVDGTDSTDEIYGFVPSDSIKLSNVPYDPSDQVVVGTPGVVTIVTPDGDYDFNIAGATVGETGFNVSGDLLLTEAALCYLRGTKILTPIGEKPVEAFAIGDLVVTRFGGIRAVRWIGRQSYDVRFLRNNPDKFPVRIAAGALGANSPARDLFVSAGHSVLLGETLVLARALVNGVTITQPRAAATPWLEYFQIELAGHDCVIAEGAFAETYADGPGLRAQFHNAAEYEALYPDAKPAEALLLCAKRPERGAELEAVLAPVVARAAAGLRLGALEGFVDLVSAWKVEGWAMDQAQPDLPVRLEILAGTRLLGTVLACDFRADLAEAGKGRGRCAFTFTPPAPLPEDVAITVRRAKDGTALPWSRPEKTKRVG